MCKSNIYGIWVLGNHEARSGVQFLYRHEQRLPASCAVKPLEIFSPVDFVHEGTFSPPPTACSMRTATFISIIHHLKKTRWCCLPYGHTVLAAPVTLIVSSGYVLAIFVYRYACRFVAP